MIYRTARDLVDGILVPETSYRCLELWRAYQDAIDNPPEGVIGVGAITYAQYKLLEAQGVSE